MNDPLSPTEEWELPPDSVAYKWVQEIKQEGQEEWLEKGIEQGTYTSIQIIKLLQKGIPHQQIAEQLEVPLQRVQRIARELAED
ncbi:MAG: helix-turn-helix domain-containing protein [Bacteroidota bacterium]